MPMKNLSTFVREGSPANTEEQVKTLRNLLIALIASGAMDASIKKDLLMKEEIHTHSPANDEERYRRRLQAFRQGLKELLAQDATLDDHLLRKHGITRFDRTGSAE